MRIACSLQGLTQEAKDEEQRWVWTFPRKREQKNFHWTFCLGKNGKGYGIGSLLLTCHLLSSGSFSFTVNCQLLLQSWQIWQTLLPLCTLHITSCTFLFSSDFLLSKEQFGEIHFPSSVSTIFFKMAGTALIYGFHHNTYSKTICSCLKTFGSFAFTLLFYKACKPQQFHHLLPTLGAFTSAFQIRSGLDFWSKPPGGSPLARLWFPRQNCLRVHDMGHGSSLLVLNTRCAATIHLMYFICQWTFSPGG